MRLIIKFFWRVSLTVYFIFLKFCVNLIYSFQLGDKSILIFLNSIFTFLHTSNRYISKTFSLLFIIQIILGIITWNFICLHMRVYQINVRLVYINPCFFLYKQRSHFHSFINRWRDYRCSSLGEDLLLRLISLYQQRSHFFHQWIESRD